MSGEHVFRWVFVAIFLSVFSVSGYFRWKARQTGDVIPRAREGPLRILMRLLFAAPLYLSMIAYMLNPDWMAWSSLSLPAWLRWTGVAVVLAMLPGLLWVFTSLGRNVSETVLTKERHALVTHGPYRWVRHPLYTTAIAVFLALGLVAANWFIIVMALLVIWGVWLFIIPMEEAQLTQKFGERYLEYSKSTGRLTPRW